MKDDDIEEVKKQLGRSQLQVKNLIEEIEIKDKTIQLLLIAGHLDKEKLEQATELAGGI